MLANRIACRSMAECGLRDVLLHPRGRRADDDLVSGVVVDGTTGQSCVDYVQKTMIRSKSRENLRVFRRVDDSENLR